MSSIWPDPEDCDALGQPISLAGRRARVLDARARADAFERDGQLLEAAQTRVFAVAYEFELDDLPKR